jgi:hypothetical protein
MSFRQNIHRASYGAFQTLHHFNMAGWKGILRPIRDGLEKLLPSPPNNQDDTQRRVLDTLHGFTSFKTFDEIQLWNEIEADDLQRASIPLMARPDTNARLLLIHDYAGGFRPEESIGCQGLDQEGFYCEELQLAKSFVYFSHRLVTIPPPAWTNMLHRNGVKSLGTFIIEPGTKGIEKLFEIASGGHNCYTLARQLAHMASVFGFDGYLINIETPFPERSWEIEKLLGFLRELRSRLGEHGQLIW